MTDFINWVNQELKNAGLNYSDVAKRANVSASSISMTMNLRNAVTWDFCYAISISLGLPPEYVFRRASLLPITPKPQNMQLIIDMLNSLDEQEIDNVLEYVQWRYSKSHGNS